MEIENANSSSCLDGAMNEQELNSRLKNVPNYQGSFALDELTQVKIRYPTFLVVNLDERNSRGNHWIALAIYFDSVYVCDTLGGVLPSRKWPQKWLNFLSLITVHRSLFITKQLSDSGLCGLFCVTFILEMSKHNNFKEFISLFSSDLSTNDTIVKFLNK